MERSSSSKGQWIPYPPGESSADSRCSSGAAASLDEHSSHGIRTSRSGRNMTSPSRRGLILLAVRTSVTFTACDSKHSLPFLANQIKMIEDDFPHFTPQSVAEIKGPCFLDLIRLGLKPELTF